MGESNPEVKQAIRDALEEQLEDHELPEVFWSLDAVYDEYDKKMQEHQLTEVPIFEAKIVVHDSKSTSGERYESQRIDGVTCREEAEERLEDDPEVIRVESMEQVETAEVYL